jgi:hypothetical protein
VTARKLDDFDCGAIYLLQRNARLTNRKLANALGLSETALKRRLFECCLREIRISNEIKRRFLTLFQRAETRLLRTS